MSLNFKEIQELIKLINKSNLTEFRMKEGDFQLSIRTKKYGKVRNQQVIQPQQQVVPVQTSMAAVPMPAAAPASGGEVPKNTDAAAKKQAEAPAEVSDLLEIRSPIVGTFYRSASPDKPAYVKPGQQIEVGDVVCIVEAMKLFNEIESEISGKIVEVLIDDATPIEYDQVLFRVDPNA